MTWEITFTVTDDPDFKDCLTVDDVRKVFEASKPPDNVTLKSVKEVK
jgi:hypothetical protein